MMQHFKMLTVLYGSHGRLHGTYGNNVEEQWVTKPCTNMRHEIFIVTWNRIIFRYWGGNNISCKYKSHSDPKSACKPQMYSILNEGLCKESTGDPPPFLIFEYIK